MIWWMYGAVLFTAALVSWLLVPVAIRLSQRSGAMTKVGGRRREMQPMPRLGGIAIAGGFLAALLLAQWVPVPRQDPQEAIRLTGLAMGTVFCFLFWSVDDIVDLNPTLQYAGQLIAGGIAVTFLIFIEFFNNPLTGSRTEPWPHFVTVAITLLWIGVMMNTVNFLDGLDGLAAGVATIAGAILFVNSAIIINPAQESVALLPLALVGACLGFLLYNFHPASIYLGGGAQIIGFLLATLSIIGGAKMATILLVMGLPLVDMTWQIFSRILRGQNPMKGDRGHLHFRLLDDQRFTVRQIVLAYYAFCAFFGMLTLVLDSQLYKFIAFGVMLALVVGVMLVLIFRQARREAEQDVSGI